MGFSDFLKNAAEKTSDMLKAEKENSAEMQRILEEESRMVRASFPINSGYQQVNASPNSVMLQRQDGTIYFNNNRNDQFLLIDYQWSGPHYETNISSETNVNGQEVTKGKGGRMAAGAVIGTMLFPGVGTAVGAAIGAGGKKKKNKNEKAATNSVQRQTEVLTPATLRFKDKVTGNQFSIVIGCNTYVDSQIRGFRMFAEQSVRTVSKDATDALNGIKALKELLDMGAITQEEFDNKKAQLLNN